MSAVKSLTKGSPAKLIFLFALPLMLGNVFQQFYTITDSLIISRSLGMNALSALGSADWYDYMIISVIQSAGQGFAILMAQQFGAGDEKSLQKTIAHSLILVTIITVLAASRFRQFSYSVICDGHGSIRQYRSGSSVCTCAWIWNCRCCCSNCHCPGMWWACLSAYNAETAMFPSEKGRFRESGRFEYQTVISVHSDDASEYDDLRWRYDHSITRQPELDQFYCRLYRNKQTVCSIGTGCGGLWICDGYLHWPECWSKAVQTCAKRLLGCCVDCTVHFGIDWCHDHTVTLSINPNVSEW